jgi:hypothetical protein
MKVSQSKSALSLSTKAWLFLALIASLNSFSLIGKRFSDWCWFFLFCLHLFQFFLASWEKMGDSLAFLRRFDVFPKTVDDAKEQSASGGGVSIFVLLCMAILFISEVRTCAVLRSLCCVSLFLLKDSHQTLSHLAFQFSPLASICCILCLGLLSQSERKCDALHSSMRGGKKSMDDANRWHEACNRVPMGRQSTHNIETYAVDVQTEYLLVICSVLFFQTSMYLRTTTKHELEVDTTVCVYLHDFTVLCCISPLHMQRLYFFECNIFSAESRSLAHTTHSLLGCHCFFKTNFEEKNDVFH